MRPETGLFYFVAAVALGSALVVVTARNMVRAIFLFFVSLFAIAGLYIFSLADFVALTQVVVYAGGVLVLMLFAFMLSDKDILNRTVLAEAGAGITLNKLAGFALAAIFFALLVMMVIQEDVDQSAWLQQANNQFQPADNSAPAIGISLMTRYLLPFELVSVFLLMALIGAVHLSRNTPEGMIPLSHYLLISALLFCIGLYAVLTRRNTIMVLIGIEFMINAAILNFVAFGKYDKGANGGQLFALFAIVLAAAGVAVALAIILNVYKHYRSIDPSAINKLRD